MKLERAARYLVETQTSTYTIDTGTLRACRSRRPDEAAAAPGADRPVHKKLFTDGAPLVLVEVPDVEVGAPMRLRIYVPRQFLDAPAPAEGTPMVTTSVTAVRRLP